MITNVGKDLETIQILRDDVVPYLDRNNTQIQPTPFIIMQVIFHILNLYCTYPETDVEDKNQCILDPSLKKHFVPILSEFSPDQFKTSYNIDGTPSFEGYFQQIYTDFRNDVDHIIKQQTSVKFILQERILFPFEIFNTWILLDIDTESNQILVLDSSLELKDDRNLDLINCIIMLTSRLFELISSDLERDNTPQLDFSGNDLT